MKKYFCIEIPCNPDGTVPPAISLAIAEISQFVTRKLREVGVDPVRTIHTAVEDKDQ